MAGTVTSIVMVRDSFAIKTGWIPPNKSKPDTVAYFPEDGTYNVGDGEGEIPSYIACQFLVHGDAAPHTIDGNLFDTRAKKEPGE